MRTDADFHILPKRKKKAQEALDGEHVQFVALQAGDLRLADFETLRCSHLCELLALDQPIDLNREPHFEVEHNRIRQPKILEEIPRTWRDTDRQGL